MAKKNTQQDVRARRKTTSFSMVSNPIIDDKNITPAAGWLYVLIQRWVTFNAEDFVCSKSFIASKYQAGYRMFNRAWDELKDAGYLKMYSHPTEGWEFDLLDAAEPNTPHTYYLDVNGEIKSTNVDRAAKKAAKTAQGQQNDHYPQNDSNGDHYPQNDSNGNDSNGNDSNGNGGNIINTSFKNFNNDFNNQSINPMAAKPPKEKPTADRLIDDEMLDDIKNQIAYDVLSTKGYEVPKEFIDTVVISIAELYSTNEPMTFNKRKYDVKFVRNRAMEINEQHVKYVYDCFVEHREKIKNIKKYIMAALFNAPDTHETYVENDLRSQGFLWN